MAKSGQRNENVEHGEAIVDWTRQLKDSQRRTMTRGRRSHDVGGSGECGATQKINLEALSNTQPEVAADECLTPATKNKNTSECGSERTVIMDDMKDLTFRNSAVGNSSEGDFVEEKIGDEGERAVSRALSDVSGNFEPRAEQNDSKTETTNMGNPEVETVGKSSDNTELLTAGGNQRLGDEVETGGDKNVDKSTGVSEKKAEPEESRTGDNKSGKSKDRPSVDIESRPGRRERHGSLTIGRKPSARIARDRSLSTSTPQPDPRTDRKNGRDRPSDRKVDPRDGGEGSSSDNRNRRDRLPSASGPRSVGHKTRKDGSTDDHRTDRERLAPSDDRKSGHADRRDKEVSRQPSFQSTETKARHGRSAPSKLDPLGVNKSSSNRIESPDDMPDFPVAKSRLSLDFAEADDKRRVADGRQSGHSVAEKSEDVGWKKSNQ